MFSDQMSVPTQTTGRDSAKVSSTRKKELRYRNSVENMQKCWEKSKVIGENSEGNMS